MSPSCPLLDTLPAEIRNKIYHLSFTGSAPIKSSNQINLLAAEPPTTAFLQTCKNVRHEASGIYKSSYQSFWRDNVFVIDSHLGPVTKEQIENLPEYEMSQIAGITVHCHRREPGQGYTNWRYDFVDPRGLWEVTGEADCPQRMVIRRAYMAAWEEPWRPGVVRWEIADVKADAVRSLEVMSSHHGLHPQVVKLALLAISVEARKEKKAEPQAEVQAEGA